MRRPLYHVKSESLGSSLILCTSLICVSSDDSASATSSMEVTDRIASLEQRVQMQEDEIQLLKSALADVVRRLNLSEEQQAMGSRRGPTKGNCSVVFMSQYYIYLIYGTSTHALWVLRSI